MDENEANRKRRGPYKQYLLTEANIPKRTKRMLLEKRVLHSSHTTLEKTLNATDYSCNAPDTETAGPSSLPDPETAGPSSLLPTGNSTDEDSTENVGETVQLDSGSSVADHDLGVTSQDSRSSSVDGGDSVAGNDDTDDDDGDIQDSSVCTQVKRDETLINVLLLTALRLRHCLTNSATQDLLTLLTLKTGLKPLSKYQMKRLICKVSAAEWHHTCPAKNCNKYLGVKSGKTFVCSYCNTCITSQKSIAAGKAFIYLSLIEQLRELLENHNISDKLYNRHTRVKENPYAVEDIYDGDMYKKHRHLNKSNNLSINFSSDGVPVFKQSNSSLWPILCTLNELPAYLRKSKVMIASLWFGPGKPDMASYLAPFVAECKKLSTDGITYQLGDTLMNRKVFVLAAVCDSVARPLLQCCMQFNGLNGCCACLHEGVSVEKDRGFVRVYPHQEVELRTHEGTLEDMKLAEREGTVVRGIKSISTLVDIEGFNVVDGFVPDSMHSVLLGICRQFLTLWLLPKYSKRDFYVGDQLNILNSRLLAIQPTDNISRTPRSLVERRFWKAHELFNWLHYYSLPVLKGIMGQKYVDHWAHLVSALSILSGKSMMKTDIWKANTMLVSFVENVELLYGLEHVSFNVHLCEHLAKSVSNWGPLWSHSAFVYEDFNQELLSSIRSSNGVSHQIVEIFELKMALPKLKNLCWTSMTEQERDFLCELLSFKKRQSPKDITQLSANVAILGKLKKKTIAKKHYVATRRSLNINVSSNSVVGYCDRVYIQDEIYYSKEYTKVRKRNSYTILLKDGLMLLVETYVIVEGRCYAIGLFLRKRARTGLSNKVELPKVHRVDIEKELSAVNVTSFLEKVIFIEFEQDRSFVCLQNNFEFKQ